MPKQKRDKIEKMIDILRECESPMIYSKITRNCYMSWNDVDYYVKIMIDRGFMKVVEDEYNTSEPSYRPQYQRTEKGKELLMLLEMALEATGVYKVKREHTIC